MLIRDRLHDRADGEAVEVVVDENQHAEQDRGQLRADAGLDVLRRPAAERLGAARLVHQGDHRAEQHEEDQDADVVGIRNACDKAVLQGMYHRPLQ